jgi:hypothetical protein
VRRRRDEEDLSVRIVSEVAQQFVALMLNSGSRAARAGRGMRLVHDNEIRRMREEPVTLRSRFDEVDAGDEVRVMLVNRYVGARQLPFEPPHLGGLNEHRTDPEFLKKRPLPLVAKMRGAQHGEPAT